jgi:regulator of protease activity HflC (stomatin/prohibitin superfamily)
MAPNDRGLEPANFAEENVTMSELAMWLTVGGLALLALALSGLRIAQEYQRAVVFRLGRFHSVRGPGLYYNIPLLEWQKKVDMRTVTVGVEPRSK